MGFKRNLQHGTTHQVKFKIQISSGLYTHTSYPRMRIMDISADYITCVFHPPHGAKTFSVFPSHGAQARPWNSTALHFLSPAFSAFSQSCTVHSQSADTTSHGCSMKLVAAYIILMLTKSFHVTFVSINVGVRPIHSTVTHLRKKTQNVARGGG